MGDMVVVDVAIHVDVAEDADDDDNDAAWMKGDRWAGTRNEMCDDVGAAVPNDSLPVALPVVANGRAEDGRKAAVPDFVML